MTIIIIMQLQKYLHKIYNNWSFTAEYNTTKYILRAENECESFSHSHCGPVARPPERRDVSGLITHNFRFLDEIECASLLASDNLVKSYTTSFYHLTLKIWHKYQRLLTTRYRNKYCF